MNQFHYIQGKLGFSPVRWEDGALIILDQRRLPGQLEYVALKTPSEVAMAIANLAVRGAPLIGIVAAYGLCLADDPHDDNEFAKITQELAATRPTAVNLAWAIERMRQVRNTNLGNKDLKHILLTEACRIHSEDAAMCARIGEIGNALLPDGARILTHCNAGALATGGIGTALGILYTAHFSGKKIEVWVDETRPVLQGARLTAWELGRAGVPYTLISDNMAGHIMSLGMVDLVITGADRIAANLDFANKIGTYSLAVLASHHHIPFYAAAPSSTFDQNAPDGRSINIEVRAADEVQMLGNQRVTPSDCKVYNPAFDITPHHLISGIITENGVIEPKK